ncbi:COP9/signalosome complex subunit Csn1 [Orobanche gracilis]
MVSMSYLSFSAVGQFLETGPALENNYTEVIAPQDIATYGSLCALASFDRAELKSKVIDNINFRNFLELVPEVRELVNDFHTSHYASCLEYLGNLKANLLLDIHLHDHVETLYEQIRNKALIQYTLPFVSVDIHMMANAFNTTITALEKELEALITNDQVQARIDSHNKILYARHADQRNGTFQRVLQTGNEFDREVRAMLLRANLIKHDYNQKASSRKH